MNLIDDIDVSDEPKDTSLYPILKELEKKVCGNESEMLLIFLSGLTGMVKNNQQFLIVTGDTSAGKTYTMKAVLETLIPEQLRYEFVTGSKTSLNYLGNYLKGKMLIIASEVQKMPHELQEILKSMHSRDGGAKRSVTNAVDKNVETYITEPIAVALTYAEHSLDEQLATRCILLSLPEDIETTKKIVKHQSEMYFNKRKFKPDYFFIDSVKKRISSAFKYRQYDILVPYFNSISEIIDFTQIRARSDINKYFALISALTQYNFQHRVVDNHRKIILSTPEDAFQVIEATGGLLDKTTKELSETEYAILHIMAERGESINIRDLGTQLNIKLGLNLKNSYLRKKLEVLSEKGLINISKMGNENRYVILKNINEQQIKEIVWKEVIEESKKNVKENFEDLYESYLNSINLETTHPITGEKIKLDKYISQIKPNNLKWNKEEKKKENKEKKDVKVKDVNGILQFVEE